MYKLIAMSAVVFGALMLSGCGGGEETQTAPKVPDKGDVKEEIEKKNDAMNEIKDEAKKAIDKNSDAGTRQRTFGLGVSLRTVAED